MKLSFGAQVAVGFWLVIAAIVWWFADAETDFDRQVRARCELLGGVFSKGVDGSLACRHSKIAGVQ